MRLMVMAAAAALVLCGCRGDAPAAEDAPPAAPAASVPGNVPPPSEAPAASPRADRTTTSAEPQPTAADSAAAKAEDVSPEWKQRSRSMESFASCMEKVRGAPEAVRPNLEAACRRLPDAQK